MLNRRRTPSSAAGAVVSLTKKVGEAKVFQEIVCLVLFEEVEYTRSTECLTCKQMRTRIGLDLAVAPRNYANRHSHQIQSSLALECKRRAEPPAPAGARHDQGHSAMHNLRHPVSETFSDFSQAAFA